MSKHTPGPWLVREFATYNRAVVQPWVMDSIPDGPNGKVVANAIACCSLTNPDCGANAKLIAAAPDLLAACKLHRELKELSKQVYGNPCGAHEEKVAYQRIVEIEAAFESAIAKAEGA